MGADIGGIPELIVDRKTGELFESGNEQQLKEKIVTLWKNPQKVKYYSQNCREIHFATIEEYAQKIKRIYTE